MQSRGLPSLQHLQAMMGPHGLYQHATNRVPLLSEGYCTDDNARAVAVLLKYKDASPPAQHALIDRLLNSCWDFVLAAQDNSGGLYNFRDARGAWLTPGRSEDMYARVMRACAALVASGVDVTEARRLYNALLPRGAHFKYVRSAAEALVAGADLPASLRETSSVRSAANHLAATLLTHWQNHSSAAWPWFERSLTYANALLPHGLLAARQIGVAPQSALVKTLHTSTEFLLATTIRQNIFIPIGSNGWYVQGSRPSTDNQQPIEASTMFDFLLAYQRVFPAHLTPAAIAAPYLWFFGQNTHGVCLAQADGSSFDGLFLRGPNRNCGAESMLAYLWAELRFINAPQPVKDYVATARQHLPNPPKPAV